MRRCSEIPAMRAVAPTVGLTVALGMILAGCSDIYYDRRESILLGADDAVASNIAVQTIDPWPPNSVNRRAPANGERVAAAIKRYRTGRVFIPVGNATSSSYQQQQQQQQQMMSADPPSPTSSGASGGAGAIPTGNGTQVK
jgi:hypothetical protein